MEVSALKPLVEMMEGRRVSGREGGRESGRERGREAGRSGCREVGRHLSSRPF